MCWLRRLENPFWFLLMSQLKWPTVGDCLLFGGAYDLSYHQSYFSKFYGKFGVISWLLFPTSFEKNYILQTLTWKLELWSFSTCFTFTHEKRQEKNFYHKNFMAENNHVLHWSLCIICIYTSLRTSYLLSLPIKTKLDR